MTSSDSQEQTQFTGRDRRRQRDSDSYFNSQFEAQPLYVEPRQSQWSDKDNEMIVATLGSGVAVCVYDRDLHIGAVGYVLISEPLRSAFPYFDTVNPPDELEKCLQPIIDCIGHMKRHGAAKKRIYVRLVGGASLPGDTQDSGTKNYVFAREFISRQGLAVLNEDLGGEYIRRLHFFPATGRAVRRVLRRDSDFETMKALEARYAMNT